MKKRKKFCPECGKITKIFYDNLCKDCFLKTISVINLLPKGIKINQCKYCKRYVVEKKLTHKFNEIVECVLKEILKQNCVKKIEYDASNKDIKLDIFITAKNLKKIESVILPVKINKITCRYCNMMRSGYHNAVLQISCPDELKNEILKLIRDQMTLLSTKDNLAFITERIDKPHGFDLKIGSKKASRKIAKLIKDRYKGKIKHSKKLVGKKHGKNVYRESISIRIL